MQQRISPASAISGAITLPGDKSISHRYAMISAIADGESRVLNYSTGADCHSTLGCVRALGIDVRSEEHTSELQSLRHLVCRLLLEKKKKQNPHEFDNVYYIPHSARNHNLRGT